MKIEGGPSRTHWPSLLVLICLLPGAGFFLLGSIGFLINSLYLIFDGSGDPVGSMIAALSAVFEGVLLLIASWFVFLKTSGQGTTGMGTKLNYPERYVFIAVVSVVAAFLIGSAISIHNYLASGLLLQPGFTLLVIVTPILLLAYMAIRNIYLVPQWQTWAIIGLGMTLAPFIMICIELFFGFIFIVILTLVIASQPELIFEITRVMQNFDPELGQGKLMKLIASLVAKPGVIAGILLYLTVFVPLTEELFKPLGVWLFSSKIHQPSQGFALGIVCGAAFAIVEGLGISGQGGPQWPIVVGLRFGTSLLHLATTGLMGYAIILALKEKRILMLVITYLTTVLIHGLWNGAAAGIGISVVSEISGINHSLNRVIPAAIGGISVLVTGLLIMLHRINQRLGA